MYIIYKTKNSETLHHHNSVHDFLGEETLQTLIRYNTKLLESFTQFSFKPFYELLKHNL